MPISHRLGLLLAAATLPLAAQGGYTITTVAGGVPPPTPIQAVAASVGGVYGVATDSAGNFYFASALSCVFKVDATGVMTRVAGTCRAGYSGDGGAATSAQMRWPVAVALDSAGNLYIVEGNNVVRKVSPGGIITTVAGNGVSGYSGDGGPATSAQLSYPNGVAVDLAGNLYIADSGNNRVRKVSAGGTITTVAGNGTSGYSGDGGPATSAQLSFPYGVAVDPSGSLYISGGNYVVRKVTPAGIITTIAGNGSRGFSGDGGPATGATLYEPMGVALDSAGNLYLVDCNRVRQVSRTGIITTVAGTISQGYSGDGGPATAARLAPVDVAVDLTGNLYIAEPNNSRVRRVSLSGIITTVAGGGSPVLGDGNPATSVQLSPQAVAVDSAGVLYIADLSSNRVRNVSPGGLITTVAGNGTFGYSGDGGAAASAELSAPIAVAVDESGNLYIGDIVFGVVRKVSRAGIITTVAGNGISGYSGDGGLATNAMVYPDGLAFDSAGNLYIADAYDNRVRKVSPSGIITTIVGTFALSYPFSVAVDSVGNLYLADAYDSVVRKVPPAANTITIVAGTSSAGYSGDGGPGTSAMLSQPNGVAVDAAGNLYIADTYNNRVRVLSPAGIITTVAGNGTQGYSGDGGPANSAMLNQPTSVAVDSVGNVYVVDSGNNAVRRLHPLSTVSVTVTTIPSGLAILVDGSNLNAPQTFSWTAGSQHSVGVASPQKSGTSYNFTGWSDGGAQTHTITASSTATYTASFAVAAGSGLHFYPLTPCRVVDTRGNGKAGVFGPPSISGGSSRDFPISASACNIPATTAAYSLNVAVVPPSQLTYLSMWPTGQSMPTVSTLNDFSLQVATPGNVVANAAIVPAGANGSVSVFVSDTSDVIVDVNGYFAPPATGGLAFYPVTPCRVADTRDNGKSSSFGPPTMAAGSHRSFPIPQSSCNVPSAAQAYSLNVTAVPPGQLTYLTTWPSGQSMPTASTLSDFSLGIPAQAMGKVVANAAIVPAGTNGAVSVFASDATDLIIDIDGYFAPPGTGSLSFYPTTPCRVADTRGNGFAGTFFGPPSMIPSRSRTFPIPQSSCVVPTNAQAYSLNMTVVPPNQLTYLTTWPSGLLMPTASTLNDFSNGTVVLGRVVANAAIVPAGTNGAVDVYGSDPTDVIIDINGYFAP